MVCLSTAGRENQRPEVPASIDLKCSGSGVNSFRQSSSAEPCKKAIPAGLKKPAGDCIKGAVCLMIRGVRPQPGETPCTPQMCSSERAKRGLYPAALFRGSDGQAGHSAVQHGRRIPACRGVPLSPRVFLRLSETRSQAHSLLRPPAECGYPAYPAARPAGSGKAPAHAPRCSPFPAA